MAGQTWTSPRTAPSVESRASCDFSREERGPLQAARIITEINWQNGKRPLRVAERAPRSEISANKTKVWGEQAQGTCWPGLGTSQPLASSPSCICSWESLGHLSSFSSFSVDSCGPSLPEARVSSGPSELPPPARPATVISTPCSWLPLPALLSSVSEFTSPSLLNPIPQHVTAQVSLLLKTTNTTFYLIWPCFPASILFS